MKEANHDNTTLGVSFDTNHAAAIATFWARVLRRTVTDVASETFAAVAAGEGSPVLMFHKVPEPKTVKNRLHFDLKTGDFTAESERLLGLCATQLTTLADNGGKWVTFADAGGNEFGGCGRLFPLLKGASHIPGPQPWRAGRSVHNAEGCNLSGPIWQLQLGKWQPW